MANKITCTCGHSWSTADSSAKDKYVCHICGKDTRSDVSKAQVGDEVPAQKITPEMIKGWNEYRNYLDEQGLFGDPRLNTGFGKKTFVDWATKNPNYGVNWETLPIIGEELAAHKQKVKEAVGRGKVSLSTPISEFNATDVTNAKSKNPWWPGTEFTSQEFADYVEKIKDSSGKVIKEKNYGVLPSTETYDKNRLNVDKKDIPINIVKSIAKQKNGGWLDRYDEGGEYLGTTNKGFNYNGAWGGPSMQVGGDVPQVQDSLWSTNKRAYVDSSLNANKDIEWVKRFYESNPKAVMVPGEKYPSTHLIGDNDQGYVFPRIVNMNGQLVDLGDSAEDYARKTNTGIQFPKEQGTWFARSTGDDSGYKMGTGVLKGKPVMQKYKSIDKKAMGGSLPGSVGFTYARTQGAAPANGKYTKKTKASAQNGMEMKFYQEGLDWKPRNISRDGSVIKDDRGQWAHPGEITEIGSPNITMEGVPYPVLGISDTGDTQMMYPGEDYKFKGKKVTEYPIAQDGRVQRAASANLNFWEKCRLASAADNGGGGRIGGGSDKPSKYKNPYEEISDIKSYEKDERRAFEKSLPEGIDIADWVAMNRDASRMSALTKNPDYEKYTDEQGLLKPEYQSVATRFDPYYLYYKPAFSGKKEVSPMDILEYQKSQPGGLAGYKELVNRRYMPEKKKQGGWLEKYK